MREKVQGHGGAQAASDVKSLWFPYRCSFAVLSDAPRLYRAAGTALTLTLLNIFESWNQLSSSALVRAYRSEDSRARGV